MSPKVNPKTHEPLWEVLAIEGPLDALVAVGEEAAARLFENQAIEQFDDALKRLGDQIPVDLKLALGSLFGEALDDAILVGLRLGAGLADVGWLHGSYEEWLQNGIATAGLTGYQYRLRVELLERWWTGS